MFMKNSHDQRFLTVVKQLFIGFLPINIIKSKPIDVLTLGSKSHAIDAFQSIGSIDRGKILTDWNLIPENVYLLKLAEAYISFS